MPVTLREIARAADVSEMTVSNVLNGRYTPVQRKAVARANQIKALAEKMGYRPNAAAKATRSGRFGSACLLMSIDPNRSALFGGTLFGLHDTFARHDMQLTVSRMPDADLTDESKLPKFLREACCDGLVINYIAGIPPELIDNIHRQRIPAIWVNSRHHTDCVHPDDFAGSRHATVHLLRLGHRRIAFSDYSHGREHPNLHYSVTERIAGYSEAMVEAGLQPRVIQGEGFNIHGSQRIAHSRQVLSAPDRPTAVICYGRNDTIPFFSAAVAEGLEVPRDLSLIEFADHPADVFGPLMSTVLLPQEALGRTAADMLIQKIENPNQDLPRQAIATGFEPGGTCVPPPPAAS